MYNKFRIGIINHCLCNAHVITLSLCSFQGLILRDVFLLTIISIGFELLEYTLEPHLPNFGECWWDHVSLCYNVSCVLVILNTYGQIPILGWSV